MTLPCDPLPPLPLHLRQTDPLEVEQLPLQVALLTMEVAQLRERMALAAAALEALAGALTLPDGDLMGVLPSE